MEKTASKASADNAKILSRLDEGFHNLNTKLTNQQADILLLPSRLKSMSRGRSRAEASSRRGRTPSLSAEREEVISNHSEQAEMPAAQEPTEAPVDEIVEEDEVVVEEEVEERHPQESVFEERIPTPLSFVKAEPRRQRQWEPV